VQVSRFHCHIPVAMDSVHAVSKDRIFCRVVGARRESKRAQSLLGDMNSPVFGVAWPSRRHRNRRSSDIRDRVIDDRQENLNVAFGSLADLTDNTSSMSGFWRKAAVGKCRFRESQAECLLFSKADVFATPKSPNLGSAFGQKQPVERQCTSRLEQLRLSGGFRPAAGDPLVPRSVLIEVKTCVEHVFCYMTIRYNYDTNNKRHIEGEFDGHHPRSRQR